MELNKIKFVADISDEFTNNLLRTTWISMSTKLRTELLESKGVLPDNYVGLEYHELTPEIKSKILTFTL